jgi:hypothetical protein
VLRANLIPLGHDSPHQHTQICGPRIGYGREIRKVLSRTGRLHGFIDHITRHETQKTSQTTVLTLPSSVVKNSPLRGPSSTKSHSFSAKFGEGCHRACSRAELLSLIEAHDAFQQVLSWHRVTQLRDGKYSLLCMFKQSPLSVILAVSH